MTNEPTKTTIYDVAEQAGVSLKTVSRVINRESSVREKTRDKVLAAMQELQYQPSQSARSLAGRKSFLLGLVYSNPSDSYIIRAQHGALQACHERDFGLLILPCDHQQKELADELIRQIRQARLDGIVLTPPLTEDSDLRKALERENIAFACVAPRVIDNSVSVGCDDQQAAETVCEYLIERGHRRIAHIGGHCDHSASELRRTGYNNALQRHGIKPQPHWIETGDFEFSAAKAATQKLLQQTPYPSAIFAASDDMACAALVAIHERGLRVPQDISVVGFDDSPLAQQTWPALTTVQQPVEDMVELAVAGLIDKLSEASLTAKAQPPSVLNCVLIERDSVADYSA